MTPEQIKEHNEGVAAALITAAQYIALSEEKAQVRLGMQFKLPKQSWLRIPVLPVERVIPLLGRYASEQVIKVVERYQKASGTKDGQEVIDAMRSVQAHLG